MRVLQRLLILNYQEQNLHLLITLRHSDVLICPRVKKRYQYPAVEALICPRHLPCKARCQYPPTRLTNGSHGYINLLLRRVRPFNREYLRYVKRFNYRVKDYTVQCSSEVHRDNIAVQTVIYRQLERRFRLEYYNMRRGRHCHFHVRPLQSAGHWGQDPHRGVVRCDGGPFKYSFRQRQLPP